jgi:hypothetical protein
MYATETNTFTSTDWLNISKDMSLSAYDPTSQATEQQGFERSSAIFGTHVREAIAIVKDWKADRK